MEQMIIFVYDLGYCQTESDDPQKAVLFFHPHWVSDQQRLALCGQLMGATHFCSSVFSTPKVLTLQCGKFILKKFGRYILSVGSDQSLPEWILQERFNTLELLIQFYHHSFDFIFNKVECDQEHFSKKLTEILEVYIPILQFIVCAFGNVFIATCPKKNSAAFLEAFQLLEACCNFKGVLGGTVLHNSRVIATQLNPELSKLLALTDRFHIRTHAEQLKIPFYLPVGVQLLKVHMKQKAYETLIKTANLKSSTFNGVQKKYLQKAVKTMKKKKEANKIFTVLEEEDLNLETTPNFVDEIPKLNEFIRIKNRKLKPKTENISLKERSKSFFSGLNIKVCSTPTVEKTLIHEEFVSICSSNANEKIESKTTQQTTVVPDLVQETIKAKTRNNSFHSKYSTNHLYRVSLDDLMIDLTHKAYPVPLCYYSFGLPKLCRKTEMLESENIKKQSRRLMHKTIADPLNPVFRYDGVPVSKSLYNSCLDEHYKDFITANLTIDSREEFLKNKSLESKNYKPKIATNLKSIESNLKGNSNENESRVSDKENYVDKAPHMDKELTRTNQKTFRRSLSLPLKPLLFESVENNTQSSAGKKKISLHTRTPTTPLTTKLSLLAFEEQQIDVKSFPNPNDIQAKSIKTVATDNATSKNKNGDTVGSILFICGHQNMTILLILDEDVEKNPDLIFSLWEMSTATLNKVENFRNKNLANLPTSGNNESSYSFLCMDNYWGTIQRSGLWGDEELKMAGSLHNDLVQFPKMTELIIRNEDSVVYGYSCGGTKIFYQQEGCSSASGLPTPADLMGIVTLKARRRLERDCDIVLL